MVNEEEVVCKKGKCEYKDERFNKKWKTDKDTCKSGNIVEKIECDLSKGDSQESSPKRKK